jgi:hypothetical protein
MHGLRSKIPGKNPVMQRCAEGFNSGVKGLMYENPFFKVHLVGYSYTYLA